MNKNNNIPETRKSIRHKKKPICSLLDFYSSGDLEEQTSGRYIAPDDLREWCNIHVLRSISMQDNIDRVADEKWKAPGHQFRAD